MSGLVRGIVEDVADPQRQGRICVSFPADPDHEAVWALRCDPLGAGHEALAVGDTVWIAFENGDREIPVVIGRLPSA